MAGTTRENQRNGAAGNPRNPAGHLRAPEESGPAERGRLRPVLHVWITDELVAETCRVWSKQLCRVVTDEEAIEMLLSVRSAALAIMAGSAAGDRP